MVPDNSASSTVETSTSSTGSSTAINAIIGAVAGIVLSFIPLSTLLGGAVAGYLESGTTSGGVKIGAITGVLMLIPFVIVSSIFVLFFLGFGAGGSFLAFGMMASVILLVNALYTVGLGAIGGYLGVYLKHEL